MVVPFTAASDGGPAPAADVVDSADFCDVEAQPRAAVIAAIFLVVSATEDAAVPDGEPAPRATEDSNFGSDSRTPAIAVRIPSSNNATGPEITLDDDANSSIS